MQVRWEHLLRGFSGSGSCPFSEWETLFVGQKTRFRTVGRDTATPKIKRHILTYIN